MTNLLCWEELRSGCSGELVLAVDAPPRGPVTADFHELEPFLGTRHTVWRVRERPDRHPRGIDLRAFVEPWTSEVRASGLRVRAVLGYGPGGVFAGVLAQAVGTRQGCVPEVLLVDPGSVGGAQVRERLRQVLTAPAEECRAEPPVAGGARVGSLAGLIGDVLTLATSRLSVLAPADQGACRVVINVRDVPSWHGPVR